MNPPNLPWQAGIAKTDTQHRCYIRYICYTVDPCSDCSECSNGKDLQIGPVASVKCLSKVKPASRKGFDFNLGAVRFDR